MAKGKSIVFDLISTLGERVHVAFSWKNADKSIARLALFVELFMVSPVMTLVAMEDYQGVKEATAEGVDINLALPNWHDTIVSCS